MHEIRVPPLWPPLDSPLTSPVNSPQPPPAMTRLRGPCVRAPHPSSGGGGGGGEGKEAQGLRECVCVCARGLASYCHTHCCKDITAKALSFQPA